MPNKQCVAIPKMMAAAYACQIPRPLFRIVGERSGTAWFDAGIAAVMGVDTGAIGRKLKEQGRSISEMGDPKLPAIQGVLVIMRDGGFLAALRRIKAGVRQRP